jgi:hypothetical protein
MPILRIERDRAARIIARHLRTKLTPAFSNELAETILDNLSAAMRTETKLGLTGAKIISSQPPEQAVADMLKAARSRYKFDERMAREIWHIVHRYGVDPPEDIIRTINNP